MNLKTLFFHICLIGACFCSVFLSAVVKQLIPQVENKLRHVCPAFTQGLAIEGDQLFESTGLYGQSSLRLLDLFTGQVKLKKNLPSDLFAEGVAVIGKRIYQITWKAQEAFVYDRQTLELLNIFSYVGEGWGLCSDGETLWMSDGTHRLVQRDIQTFAILKTLNVHEGDKWIEFLNDLASDGTHLYANVFESNRLIQIDKETGEVKGSIDASFLLSTQEKAMLDPSEVLNGIAFRQQTGTFYVTGKNWPWIFEVRFIPK